MKENYESYFRLSAKEIELAGPVDFVKEQIAANSNVVELFMDIIKTQKPPKQLPGIVENLDLMPIKYVERENKQYADYEEIVQPDDLYSKYQDVIAKSGDKIQILVQIPGDSLTQRMVNVVLLYLYLKLKSNCESVSYDELRQVCESHGELDKAHFSAYLKANKKIFVVEGTGKAMSAKLTIPGIREAEKLLNSLNSQNSK